jgi:hypothetical protein
VEFGLEHERAGAVAALGPADVTGGREQPAPVRLAAQQRGEAGRRVEAREVDRAVPPDQGRRLRVADQRVVLIGSGIALLVPGSGRLDAEWAECRR